MARQTGWPILLTILSLSSLLSPLAAEDTIAPGNSVVDGNSLVSADGSFKLGFFTPGRSNFRYVGIWYNSTIPVQTVVWVANRDRPLPPDSTGVLSISGNGSLSLSDAKGKVYWSTGAAPAGLANPVAKLLNSGNLVVTTARSGGGASLGIYAWQSFDYPTHSLLAGMKLGWDLRLGRSRNVTAWKSAGDPAPGEYAFAMDVVSGDLRIFLVRGTARLWRAGPRIGQSIPGMAGYADQSLMYSRANGRYFSYTVENSSILSSVVVQPTGRVEGWVGIRSTGTWDRLWHIPNDQYDRFSPCGPFGVSDTNNSPACTCVRGFKPRSPRDWYLGNFRDGCVRKTALECHKGTDGFVGVAGANLEDTSAVVVNVTMGTVECRAACLRNCSCTAYANAGVTGCVLWGGDLTDLRLNADSEQDLFVRVAAADVDTSSSWPHGRRVAAVTVVGLVAAFLGTLVLGWICWYVRRRSGRTTVALGTTTNTSSSNGDDLDLPLFDFSSIAAATNDFSDKNKLGEGGFGPVYVGQLGEGQEVAVKRLSRNSVQGVDEFKNEVMLIAKLQHRNLVRLLGCCTQRGERILVYEYMPNKSLDAFLFDKTKGSLLDWKTRYQIISGIARGLLYLHQDSRIKIIHRDLKASNVLLDKEMNPKISDFGMARMFGGNENEAKTRRVVGTYGYMSPEYIMEGAFSVKSDVFSFGVVVLEIVSGGRNRGMYLSDPNLNLLGYAWALWKARNWSELVDSSMVNSFPMAEVLKCINVGLLCVQVRPEDRPTMASVVQMLGNDTTSLPQPSQPGFMVTRGPFEVPSSSSVIEVTVTMLGEPTASENQKNRKSRRSAIMASAIVLAVVVLLVLCGCSVRRKWNSKKTVGKGSRKHLNEANIGEEDFGAPIVCGFEAIASASNNFSIGNKLGGRGFGAVYKGTLEDGREVAVKRLSGTSVQGLSEFMNEVMLICKLQHENLARLLGCCIQAEERMLMYEYMENRSLDAFIFDQSVESTRRVTGTWAWGLWQGGKYLGAHWCNHNKPMSLN